jgi:hypothetical protein
MVHHHVRIIECRRANAIVSHDAAGLYSGHE